MKKFLIIGACAAAMAMPAAAQTVDASTIINAAAQIYNATRNNGNNGYYNNNNNGYYNNGYNNGYVNPNANNGYYYNNNGGYVNPNVNTGNYQYYDNYDNTTPRSYYNNGYDGNGYRYTGPSNVRRNGYYLDSYGNRVYYRP